MVVSQQAAHLRDGDFIELGMAFKCGEFAAFKSGEIVQDGNS